MRKKKRKEKNEKRGKKDDEECIDIIMSLEFFTSFFFLSTSIVSAFNFLSCSQCEINQAGNECKLIPLEPNKEDSIDDLFYTQNSISYLFEFEIGIENLKCFCSF